jgi:hypothetical protein
MYKIKTSIIINTYRQEMSQQEISQLENEINNEKQLLLLLEQEKSALENQCETKRREIRTASDRALQTPSSGPLMMALIRQSLEVERRFTQEKSDLDRQITAMRRKIEIKEQNLALKKTEGSRNFWSCTFK